MSDFLDSSWFELAWNILGAQGLFAWVAALTPNKKDDEISFILRRIVDCLAVNFGNAKNAR